MQLESAQLLCSAVILSGDVAPYKLTHKNHPCSIWARESLSNWLYLRELAFAMEKEWRYRYGYDEYRTHKSVDAIRTLIIPPISDKGLTPFALAMPNKYKDIDPVESYRAYYSYEKQTYTRKGIVKSHTWSKRSKPSWMDPSIYSIKDLNYANV
jgi:hypothetical protein